MFWIQTLLHITLMGTAYAFQLTLMMSQSGSVGEGGSFYQMYNVIRICLDSSAFDIINLPTQEHDSLAKKEPKHF